jgi:hypothetical protein
MGRHIMRAGILTLVLLAMTITSVSGYEMSLLNIDTPYTGMPRGSLELVLNHRFYGDAFDDPLDNFFGMDDGANVSVGLRYFVVDEIDFSVSHTRALKEFTAGAGWSRSLGGPGLDAYLFAGYTSIEPAANQDREGGFVSIVSVSAGPLAGKFIPVASYAYDGQLDRSGPGFGLDILASGRISLFGEYFPVAGREESDGDEDAFSFGARYSTWGHQFVLGFTNSYGVGILDQLTGTDSNDMRVAFTVKRLFSL